MNRWRATLVEQRQELECLISRGVLKYHVEDKLADRYGNAVERAAAETGLGVASFPADCPFTLDELMRPELPE